MFNKTCTEAFRYENLVLIPISFIIALLNLVVFLAIVINQKRLHRQNYMFLCVGSTLLSNIVFLCLGLWILFDELLGTFKLFGSAKKTVWTVCQTALISMLFVMCGNVGSLLFVTLDSTYFVGRSVNRKATTFVKEGSCPDEMTVGTTLETCKRNQWLTSVKRRRAIFMLVLSWLIPLVVAIVAIFKFSCQDICILCLSGRSPAGACPYKSGCSQIWAPIHHNYLFISLVLWILEVIGIIAITISAIKSFNAVMAPPSESRNSPKKITEAEAENQEENQLSQTTKETNAEQANKQQQVSFSTKDQPDEKIRKSFFRYHSRIRFMIIITSTFIVCTLPTMVTFILDVANVRGNYTAGLYVSMLFVYLYATACPVLMLKYLPKLKSSLIVMIRNVSCSGNRSKRRKKSAHRAARSKESPE